ncbi:bacterial transcriptional activator domain-containing protein [Streptomyces atratus]|uniref:AfsR/SARP family transcriptional regulator n=1 Tax=Streptomyces atratus TaxID=1893 RepID=UPI002AC327AF|nr:bacterial transcriptional activator domain-containing protein [Streptomyces atratus]WPW33756.1 bacterial transcriptional activator domain-containing protein [Streptomyces atratus]
MDLHRFRRLIARARETADDRSALPLFKEALGLWQGEPLAGLDSPWLDDVREQLRDEQWAAELDRADALLRAGRHGERLPALSARAERHPLDERVAGQFMLALFRSGQAADALTHYQRVRGQLAEELGVDPGAPLQQLHQRVLTGDPVLARPAPQPAARPAHRGRRPDTSPAARLSALVHRPGPAARGTRQSAGLVGPTGRVGSDLRYRRHRRHRRHLRHRQDLPGPALGPPKPRPLPRRSVVCGPARLRPFGRAARRTCRGGPRIPRCPWRGFPVRPAGRTGAGRSGSRSMLFPGPGPCLNGPSPPALLGGRLR